MLNAFEVTDKDKLYKTIKGLFDSDINVNKEKRFFKNKSYRMIIFEGKKIFLAKNIIFENDYNIKIIKKMKNNNIVYTFLLNDYKNTYCETFGSFVDGVIQSEDDKEMCIRKLRFGIFGYRVFEKALTTDIWDELDKFP